MDNHWIPRETLNAGKPYKARSASDKTDDWCCWYVADSSGVRNVMTLPKGHPCSGAVLTCRETAERLANAWNAEC